MILSDKSWSFSLTAGVAAAIGVFVVYLRTLAPGVTFIDSGELAAVACTLGIAHPTGYPLFTLVGSIFSQLPIPGEEIYRLNLMAAFFSAAGIFMFYRLTMFLLETTDRSSRSSVVWHRILPAVSSAFLLAFSPTYWMQATAVEVYSIHLFFVPTLLLLFLKALQHGQETPSRHWIVFALVLGLAFTNHMTTVLLSVGLLYLFFPPRAPESLIPSLRPGRSRFVLLGVMLLPFLFGLSLYLYLPLRASQEPLFNWGDPDSLERMFRHLGGKQYTVWIFSSAETAWRQLGYFAAGLGKETAWVGLLFAIVGLRSLFRKERRYGVATVLLFVTCVGYSINYDIHDIDSYFLLAYIVIAIWASFGIRQMIDWSSKRLNGPATPALFLLGCSLVPLFVNFSERDESRNYLVEDYTVNMFNSFEQDALVLSFQWDFWVSGSYYFQAVESMRPDVAVVDKELLRRSWYLREMERRYPWLIERSRREVVLFEQELAKFEQDLPYDPAVIQARFVGMIRSFFLHNTNRPLYVTSEVEQEFTEGFERVPEGLAFRVWTQGEPGQPRMPDIKYRPFGRSGAMENRMVQLYSDAFKSHGLYYYTYGRRLSEARKYWADALEFSPEAPDIRLWLEQTGGLPKKGE